MIGVIFISLSYIEAKLLVSHTVRLEIKGRHLTYTHVQQTYDNKHLMHHVHSIMQQSHLLYLGPKALYDSIQIFLAYMFLECRNGFS